MPLKIIRLPVPLAHIGRKSALATILAALGILVSSCGRATLAFTWYSAEGKALAFRQQGSFPRGEEGSFGPGREKNFYVLDKETKIPQGSMVAAEILIESPGLTIRLAPGPDRAEPRSRANFRLSPGKAIIYLSQDSGNLRSFSIAFSQDADSSGSRGGAGWAKLESLRVVPGFHGMEGSGDGRLRISDSLALRTREGRIDTWSVTMPSRGWRGSREGESALRIAWSSRSKAEFTISMRQGARPGMASVEGSGVTLRLKAASATRRALIPLAAFGPEPTWGDLSISAPAEAGAFSAWVETKPREPGEGVDPGTLLLLAPPAEGEDFICDTWDLLPSVLLFDFRDYDTQDRYLKRLAFFVEKKGFAGRLATDEEIAPLHGWNAHDYRAEDLAAFFSAAAEKAFPLNAQERRLESFLLERGIISKHGGRYRGSSAAIISITRESPPYLRRIFLVHESTHALFFADSRYRDLCLSLWKGMDGKEAWFWKLYFGWMNYDTRSDYLMANELQAYLMQQSLGSLSPYLTKTLADRLVENHPELQTPLKAFFQEYYDKIAEKAARLDAWLRDNYGFRAGETYFLR